MRFRTKGGLRISADDEGFSVEEIEDHEVEGTAVTRRVYSPHRGRKRNAKAFRKWAVANRRKLNKMSFVSVLSSLTRAGISYLKVK